MGRTALAATALVLVGLAWWTWARLDPTEHEAPPVGVGGVPVAAAESEVGAPLVAPRDEVAEEARSAPEAPPATESKTPAFAPTARDRARRSESPRTETTSISGHVRTPSGLALDDLMVSAAPDDRRKAKKVWTRTDDSGRFEFEIPRRQDVVYRVQVAGTTEDRALRRLIQGLKAQGELRAEDVLPGQANVDFLVPIPGSLTLIAVDRATGAELGGLMVESRLESEPDFRPHGWGLQRIAPDDKGRFTIGLPAGPIVLRLSEPGYIPVEHTFVVPPTEAPLPEVVEFDACARVDLDVAMAPGSSPGDFDPRFRGLVPRDALGRPMYAAQVMLLREDEHALYVTADHESRDDVVWNELSGRLKREARLFEDEGDVLSAWPPPGRYHLAAVPHRTRFDPPTIEVGTEDLQVEATASPLEDE